MVIKNEALLRSVRLEPCCWCDAPAPSEAAHIYARGHGGGTRQDTKLNVVPLCGGMDGCHARHHRGLEPTRQDLLAMSAVRNGYASGKNLHLAIMAELRKQKPNTLRYQSKKPKTKRQLEQQARSLRAKAADYLRRAEALEMGR